MCIYIYRNIVYSGTLFIEENITCIYIYRNIVYSETLFIEECTEYSGILYIEEHNK